MEQKKPRAALPRKPLVWAIGVCVVVFVVTAAAAAASAVWSGVEEDLSEAQDRCVAAESYTPAASSYAMRDFNRVHLSSAERHGLIEPLADRDSPVPDSLVLLKDETEYLLDDMTHSRPYLTPAAARLVREIGHRFQAALKRDGLPEFRPYFTSGLRTMADQADLRGTNSNAARRSAHTYGTTFDLAYNAWDPVLRSAPAWMDHWILRGLTWGLQDLPVAGGAARRYRNAVRAFKEADRCVVRTLRARLRDALFELRQEERLWVLEEKSQPCFHITVRVSESKEQSP